MNTNYKKEAIKNLKSIIRFYEFLHENPSVCDNEDDILERLSGLIFYIGGSVYPSFESESDIIEWVKGL